MNTETTTQPTLTRGQQVMSVSFNPGQREDVAAIKQIFADCYDAIDRWTQAKLNGKQAESVHELMQHTGQAGMMADVLRLAAIAKTNLETAQMYAVKAVTR